MKNTKKDTKKNHTFQELWNIIKKSNRIIISLHRGPDGDSLGSCTALKYAIEKNTKAKVDLISYDDVSSNLKTLNCCKDVEFGIDISEINFQNYDLFIMLDAGDISMISGKMAKNYTLPKAPMLVIDHHITNPYYGKYNYINPKLSSTCSILVDMFKELNITFDSELSTRLFIGIYTDTGFFTHGIDKENYMTKVSFLLSNGAKYADEIINKINTYTYSMKQYHGLVLKHMRKKEIRQGKELYNIVYSCVPLKEIEMLKLSLSEIRQGISEIQTIKEADIVFTLTETPEGFKGSFRSKKLDTSKISIALSGGGHKTASAFFLPKMKIMKAEELIFKTIKKVGLHKI